MALNVLVCSIGLLGAARLPARHPPPSMVASHNTDLLYVKLQSLLRRAKGSFGGRAVGKNWLDTPPDRLVEASFVVGRPFLDGFDEGLELMALAEQDSGLKLPASAYAALMRLGLAESRHADVLGLFGRAQAQGVRFSSGTIVCAMRAADALADWGAVARLFSQLALLGETDAAQGPTEEETTELEVVSFGRAVPGATGSILPPASTPTVTDAFALALRAHCERGDSSRAAGVIESMGERGAALPLGAYGHIASLVKRTSSPAVLAALRPKMLLDSISRELQPLEFAVSNGVQIASASLGTVERAVLFGTLSSLVLAAIVSLLLSGLEAAPVGDGSGYADPFAQQAAEAFAAASVVF